jgi:hypothetical protein
MMALRAAAHKDLQADRQRPDLGEIEHSRDRLYRAAIGGNGTEYYLDQFALIDQPWKGKSAWNWAAMTMTFSWLIYRKMWWHAFFYFFLPYCGMVALAIDSVQMEDKLRYAAMTFDTLYLVFMFGLFPKIANAQYHAFCLRKLKQARTVSSSWQHQEAWLVEHGGTTSLHFVGIISALAIFVTTVSAESVYAVGERRIALKTIERKMQVVAQGVSDYYSYRQLLPESLKDISPVGPLSDGISDLAYDRHTGIISGTIAIPGLENKHMTWTPRTPQYIELQWTCSSPDMPDFYLPPACRTHPRQGIFH